MAENKSYSVIIGIPKGVRETTLNELCAQPAGDAKLIIEDPAHHAPSLEVTMEAGDPVAGDPDVGTGDDIVKQWAGKQTQFMCKFGKHRLKVSHRSL